MNNNDCYQNNNMCTLSSMHNSSPRVLFPMSQHIDQYPTTRGGDESNDIGGKDDDEDESTLGKGKGKATKERWNKEEDKTLVSGYLNCGSDSEERTDQTKVKLWKEIKHIYDSEVQKRKNIIHLRTMKAIRKRWATINETVTLWVSQIREANRMRTRGMAIENIEEKAHDLYNQKKKGRNFTFYHCWVAMKHLPRWMPGKDATIVS
ncbi:hypothetical protein RND81_13G054000 [Saponaria officinalis]|uniref:Myb-like domain-containing protein n=1 Tax=Saponaria officinalis TaxID=3572 RepID=A0AAW1GX13_SAPOF